MKAPDVIKFTILQDGTVKMETEAISPANHRSADDLINMLNQLLGGSTSTTRTRMGHLHSHTHDHEHAGGGHSNS